MNIATGNGGSLPPSDNGSRTGHEISFNLYVDKLDLLKSNGRVDGYVTPVVTVKVTCSIERDVCGRMGD